MIFRRNNQPARPETSFDVRGRINRQGSFGGQFAQELPFDDGVAHDDLGVEDVTFRFDDELAFGFEISGNGVGDVIVAQVDMAAAPLAHGGLRADRHLQVGAALEAGDFPDLPRTLWRAGGRFEEFLNADVLAALFAGRGDGGARFRLLVAATRAGHQDLGLFLRWHSKISRAGGRRRLSVRPFWPARGSWAPRWSVAAGRWERPC